MANIPNLPSGQDILARGKATPGSTHAYGPGSTHIRIDPSGRGVDLVGPTDGKAEAVLAFTRSDGTYIVNLDTLTASTVGYANRFIAGWGFIKRNWRTKAYEVHSAATEALMAEVEQPETVAVPVLKASKAPAVVAEPEPEVEQPQVVVETTAPVVVATLSNPVPFDYSGIIPEVGPRVKVRTKTIAGESITFLGDIAVPTAAFDTLSDALAMRRRGQTAAVKVTGPSGTAKTLMVEAFAASVGLPLVQMDGGAIRTADDWFGGLHQSQSGDSRWDFVYSPWGYALKHGIECIVLLDEGNRAETPQALNAALGLLGKQGRHYAPDAHEELRLPKGMLVVMTANEGSEYVGTVPMDVAVTQRFAMGVRLEYPIPAVEVEVLTDITKVGKDVATTLVAMANQQRPLKDDMTQFPSGIGISTRMLIDICDRHVTQSRDLRACIDSAFTSQFPVEDHVALDTIVDIHFPREANDTLDVDVDAINEGDEV